MYVSCGIECIANSASTQWYDGLAKWCEVQMGRPHPFQLGFQTTRLVYAGTESARSQSKFSFVYYLGSPSSIYTTITARLLPDPALRSPGFRPARYQISRASLGYTQNWAIDALECPYYKLETQHTSNCSDCARILTSLCRQCVLYSCLNSTSVAV